MIDKKILAYFWRFIKPYKWHYLLMLMAPLLTSFHGFFYNYAIKILIDTLAEKTIFTYGDIIFPIALFLGNELFLDLIWRTSNIAEWRSEPYVRRALIMSSYEHVQNYSYKFFQDNFTGSTSSKIKGILDGYDRFWGEMHHGLLLKILKASAGILALCFINKSIGLFMAIWAPVYAVIMYQLSKKLNHLAFDETQTRHYLMGQISDKISNIISIFSFSAKKIESKNLDDIIKYDFIPKQIAVYKYNFKIQLMGGLLYIVFFSFLLLKMVELRMHGMVSLGDFAFVFGMAIFASNEIFHATVALQDFSREMGDLKSSLSILDFPVDDDIENAAALVVKNPVIEFKSVCFNYEESTNLFNKLNLKIKAGEKIGLVGHSGAGKSSFVNLLLRYFKLHEGQILIDGQDTAIITKDSLRKNVAVIPQDIMLFHRSLMENIRFAHAYATNEDVMNACKKAHIHDFIMTLPQKYDSLVGERGIKLSGGQRQRIAIARAILKDAPILILDEATSSLDSQTEKEIQESLNILMEDKSKTIIAIAHRLSTLKHMDRILVLDNGSIIEEGRHEELLANPQSFYKRLWDLQEI